MTREEEEAKIEQWTDWLMNDLESSGIEGITEETKRMARNIIKISFNSGAVERNKHEIAKIQNSKRVC